MCDLKFPKIFFFFFNVFFFPAKTNKMKFKNLVELFDGPALPTIATTVTVLSSILALTFSMNFFTPVERIQMLLEDHETTYETLTPEIQKLSSDNQRKSIKSISSKLSLILKFKETLRSFLGSEEPLVASHANLAYSMGDWYTVRISPTYTSGLLDTKDIGNEEWWGQFVGKAFEYLWISFKMHHPFDCYYSRRKFCDVLCTHPAWANAWFEAMRFLMAAYQEKLPFAQEVDVAAYRTHMQFVAYSQKASGEMKAIASRALDAAGDKMQEADFLKRVKDAKEEWLKEVRKIKVDANMVTPQIQRSRRMSFGTPFFTPLEIAESPESADPLEIAE